jgi:YegS/Rv2252/BmrU family lipid kinase
MGKNKKQNWCFIVNPAGGGGWVKKRWPDLAKQLQSAGVEFEARFTKHPWHAAELVAEAIAQGFRQVVAVGGDGTAHEVVNGIFSQKTCPPEEVTFALLPVGTGNDWVKTHHIPRNFSRWLTCFQKGRTTFQDIGSLTFQSGGETQHRFFLNVAGLSYDGYVVKKTSEQSARLPSAIHYMWAMVRYLFAFRLPPARVIFDEKKLEGKFYTINIGICRYSGGGMQLVPQAVTDDGRLALTVARKIPKLMVLLSSPLFYLGKIGWHPQASLFTTEKVEVEPLSEMPVYVEADGEYLGEAPVRVEVLKRKLKIVVP